MTASHHSIDSEADGEESNAWRDNSNAAWSENADTGADQRHDRKMWWWHHQTEVHLEVEDMYRCVWSNYRTVLGIKKQIKNDLERNNRTEKCHEWLVLRLVWTTRPWNLHLLDRSLKNRLSSSMSTRGSRFPMLIDIFVLFFYCGISKVLRPGFSYQRLVFVKIPLFEFWIFCVFLWHMIPQEVAST